MSSCLICGSIADCARKTALEMLRHPAFPSFPYGAYAGGLVYPSLAAATALLLYEFHRWSFNKARKQYGIKPPGATGDERFDRIYRVHLVSMSVIYIFLSKKQRKRLSDAITGHGRVADVVCAVPVHVLALCVAALGRILG